MDNNIENKDNNIEVEDNQEQPPKKRKEKKVKDKKPVTAGMVIKRILLSLLITVVVICVAIYAFLFFKFKINSFVAIKQIIVLNSDVKTETIIKNQYSEEDYNSFDSKFTAFNNKQNVLLLSDKEIAGYIDYSIKNDSEDIEIKEKVSELFSSVDMSFVQLDFYDISKNPKDSHLTNVNIVMLFDVAKLKTEQLNSFPKNLIAKMVPDKLYVSIDFEISRIISDKLTNDYKVEYKSVKINNLSVSDSENFLVSMNNFIKIGTAEELGVKVGNIFADAMIGKSDNKGIFYNLVETGAKGYSFYSDSLNDYFVVYTNDINEKATITYNNLKSAENNNITSYSVLDNIIMFNNVSANGYRFLGWYDGIGSGANKLTSVSAWGLDDINVYAQWELIEYNIEYVLRGGKVDGENPTTYNIESVIILKNPYKKVQTDKGVINVPFLGWASADGSNLGLNYRIENLYGDLKLYAKFEDDERSLFLKMGNETIGEKTIILNETINKDEINTLANKYIQENFSGYVIDKWYEDSSHTKEYNFNTLISDDEYLYADLKYIVNTLTFYPYLSKFEEGIKNKKIEIASREEFIAYFEYVSFYLITDEILVKLNYLPDYSNFDNEFQIVSDAVNGNLLPYYQFSYAVFGFKGMGGVKISIVPSFWNNGGNLETIDPNKTYTHKQQTYALTLKNVNTRADDYDDFKINDVTKTLQVSHTWQLVYCLEQGYKPICEKNSNAEKIYNKAKAVLRDICDDSMNDIEKIRAMYEWLILNVNYDHKALEIAEQNYFLSEKLSKYDSWQAEGVFNNGTAVCEGYAKAFIIMSRIEGIPMIYVTGNNHAWNRVYINGKWYGIDATQGDTQQTTDKIEILTNYNFLFTDEYKTSKGCTSADYSEFKATTVYNYYKNATFTYKTTTFDLHCETHTEINTLVTAIKNYASSNGLTKYTFEVELGKSLTIYTVIDVICRVYSISSVPCYKETSVEGYSCYVFAIGA